MEKKKINLAGLAAGAGKGAADLFGKAKDTVVKAVDQNADGAFDLKDVSAIANTISNSAKNAVATAKENAEIKNRETELAQLQPLFSDDLEAPDFFMTKLVRITEIDKKHAESAVCQGSIGYLSTLKDMKVVNIFRNYVSDFGVSFYPDIDSEVYYIDPSDRDHYIAMDEYFSYLKIVRVNELQKISQDLGAKHFRVIYKEKNASSTEHSAKLKINAKAVGNNLAPEMQHNVSTNEASSVEIAAENIFPGHKPVEPQLQYLKHEPSIQTLISMRMDETSPIMHQKFTLKLSNSSGIKENDAIKIDGALKALKVSMSGSIVTEARNEANRFFEYEIDF